jgi:glucan phosphoethanolaminetransferase (alkaline phosphatase superfamily)
MKRLGKMRTAIRRLFFTVALYFGLFETVSRISVHLRESTGELMSLALFLILLSALIWVTVPLIRVHRERAVNVFIRMVAILVLLAGFHTASYFYSWYIRPNIGFYREPGWVAQHPEFQKQLRARIEANRW